VIYALDGDGRGRRRPGRLDSLITHDRPVSGPPTTWQRRIVIVAVQGRLRGYQPAEPIFESLTLSRYGLHSNEMGCCT
jgi:hypothetical protein